MIPTLIVALITFIAITVSIIFFPSVKLKRQKIGTYWVIALIGAILLLLFRLVPIKEIWTTLTSDSSINPLKILVLFLSMTFLSIFLDEVGLFHYLARKAVKVAKGNQFSLFIIFYLLTAVLTVFTSNDIVVLTLTPFICFFCKNTKINPIPYLVGEFAAANTWSMMLIIGNPTNIYLATSAGINFVEYFKVMSLPTLAAGVVQLLLIILIFYRKLKKPLEPQEDTFEIQSKVDLAVGVVHLLVCLVFLIISSYIYVEMYMISAICAGSLLIYNIIMRLCTKKHWRYVVDSIQRLPWELIPFVLSMFVIVVALEYQGIAQKMGEFLGSNHTEWTYGASSFVVANIINNIPMSILYSTLPNGLSGVAYYKAVYASIIGSNIGAFLTPIGALAGIMFTDITGKFDVNYGFKQFIKYGLLISVPTIGVALLIIMFLI